MKSLIALILAFALTSSSLAQSRQRTSLKALKAVVLTVYADHGIPKLDSRIEERAIQRLKEAGVAVLHEKDSPPPDMPGRHLNMYFVCQLNSTSCGYHTALAL